MAAHMAAHPSLESRLAALTLWYRRLADTHMRDMPINNPALRVEPAAFHRHGDDWLGVLITPWSMFLVALSEDPALWDGLEAGARTAWTLPAGPRTFTVERDPELGVYQTCPLFSPLPQFASQEQAVIEAGRIVGALLAAPEPVETAAPSEPQAAKAVRRRALFRGLLGRP